MVETKFKYEQDTYNDFIFTHSFQYLKLLKHESNSDATLKKKTQAKFCYGWAISLAAFTWCIDLKEYSHVVD